jgi:type I restriction enzyme M protein
MFRRIRIGNFRSIKSAAVDLSSFSVVVGPNGSGKSNFVDALVFLRDLANDGSAAVAARGGISSVVRWSKSRPADLSLSLMLAQDPAKVGIRHWLHEATLRGSKDGTWSIKKERIEIVTDNQTVASVDRSGERATIQHRGSVMDADLSEQASAMVIFRQLGLLGPDLRRALFGVRRYRLAPDAMRQPQPASESSVLQEDGKNIATVLRKLRGKPRFEDVINTMCKVIPGLRDIRTTTAGRYEVLEFVQQQGGGEAVFSASEMSEGSLRALGIVLAATLASKHELLLIEEPEANIHPGAAALIYDVLELASNRCDVLITTHSPDLLDAAHGEHILVCDYSSGITRLGPLDGGQRQLVRDGLFRLADLMRSEPLRIDGDVPESVDP